MTRPRRFDEPAPSVEAAPQLRTSAGSAVTATIRVTNNAPEPRVIALTTMGVDADWLPRPAHSRPVLPGETIGADLTLCPSIGTLPARYPLAIAVQALDPMARQAMSPTAMCDVELIVDAPGRVGVTVQPAAPSAVFGRRVTAVLHNAGPQPESVELEVRQPHSIRVDFPPGPVVVPAGASVPVQGRARVARPRLAGRSTRHSYTVTARTSGAPRHAEAAVLARPLLGPLGVRATVLVAVIALWAALAVIFIPKLAGTVRNQVAGANPTATSTLQTTTSAGPNGSGGNGGGGSGGGGSGGSGGGGSGGGGSGGGGSGGSGGSSGSGSSGGAAGSGISSVQLNGTMGGSNPSGVAVTLAPTSLVAQQAQDATQIGFDTDTGPVGKLTEAAAMFSAPATVSAPTTPQVRHVTTGADGAWSFPKVIAPGYYLVTLAKPGYQTQRYVIDSSSGAATQPLKVTLQPGEGHLSGTVTGPAGGVGAATVTISDGTNTITTSSDSRGAVGTWSVTGLSTPDSYLVSISHDGLATESQLVTLAAGGSGTVDLHLPSGVDSLVGAVSGLDDNGVLTGLGDAQVSASDGTTTRTATTVTTGGLVGTYTLPDLAPGPYTITISDEGYLTQTRRVVLPAGRSQLRVDATLTAATGTVTGTVRTAATPPEPVVGAGLVLSSADNTYKITSGPGGAYRITGVAPGTYVLSAQYSGLTTGEVTVTVQAGQVTSGIDFALRAVVPVYTATITGSVSGALSPNGTLICVTAQTCTVTVSFTLFSSSDPNTPIPLSATGAVAKYAATAGLTAATVGPTGYTLNGCTVPLNADQTCPQSGLPPGLYKLAIQADGYLTATVAVRVPLNAAALAPAVDLHTADAVSGTISALGDMTNDGPPGGPPYTNCVWAVPVTGATPPTAPTTCPPSGDPSYPSNLPCTQRGQPAPALVDLPNGSTGSGQYPYQLTGLCDGTYAVYVVITNPWYAAPNPPPVQALSEAQPLFTYSPTVSRLGRVLLALSEINAATGASSAPGPLTGTVSCGGQSYGNLASVSHGVVAVGGVPPGIGTVSCATKSAQTTDTPQVALSGAVSGLSVGNDQDTNAAMVLTQALGAAVGRVVSTYDGVAHGVPNVAVVVLGAIGYNGTTPVFRTVAVTTDSDGCFAITPDGSAATVTGAAHCSSVPAGASNRQLALVNAKVTVQVAATSTTPALGPSGVTLAAGAVTPVEVGALPSSIGSLALSTTPTTGVDLSAATITATSRPSAAGSLTITADSSGQLQWQDSNQPNGDVTPGTYTITAALSGYEDATATLSCQPNQACAVTAGSLQLVQLGQLSGTITGLLGTQPSDPTESVVNATVVAAACATSCPGTAPAGAPSVQTDTQGDYSFPGLPPGDYELFVSASGFHSNTSGRFTLASGSGNAAQDVQLKITLVTLDVHVQVGGSGADFTHAVVTLTNGDTPPASFTGKLSGTVYTFPGLVPGSYAYNVVGDGSSAGDAVQGTSGTIVVSRDPATDDKDNTKTFSTTIIVSSAQTSVSGQVLGASGPNPSVGLGGILAELGHLKGNTFVQDDDVNGNPMQTTTGSDGTYRFPSGKTAGPPPSGTYVVQFSATGYVTAVSTSFPISVGESLYIGAQTLTRIAHNVKVTVHAPSGDDISTSTAPTLTSLDFTGFTESAGAPVVSGSDYAWTFNQVPFGCWSFDVTLPNNHYGTWSALTGATSCKTSGFEVPGDPNDTTTEVDVGVTLTEYQPQVLVTLTALTGDTAPTTVSISATTGTGNPTYTDSSFTVSATAAALPIWVAGSQTISLDVGKPGWPSDTATITSGSPVTLSSTEQGATLTVTVTQGGKALTGTASATVSLVAPAGITYATTADATSKNKWSVTFKNVPFGTGWQAHAVLDSDSTKTGDSAQFDITSTTPPSVNVDISP